VKSTGFEAKGLGLSVDGVSYMIQGYGHRVATIPKKQRFNVKGRELSIQGMANAWIRELSSSTRYRGKDRTVLIHQGLRFGFASQDVGFKVLY
jgi:hypothetical protein